MFAFFESLETKSQRNRINDYNIGQKGGETRTRDDVQPTVGPRCPTSLESSYFSCRKGLEEVSA